MQNSMRSAKSLDNRASIAAAILALRELRDHKNRATVHFVATSQEEFTGLGARISSNRLDIKCAIVLDVTFGNQPDLAETESFALENGPAIGRGGFIPDKLYRLLVDAAKALEIPYQIEPMPSVTGTDIDTIAFNREGIPCALISIPVRYMHTPVEVVSLKDIERASRLLAEFVKRWSG